MRLSLLLPCLVMGGLLGVSVYGQSGAEPVPVEGPFGETVFEAANLVPEESFQQPESSTGESVVQEEQELRRQYRKLMELKSGLMGRSELRNAINGAVEDINQLRAAEKLDQARETLLELVKMHPQTKAAATARAMLQATPKKYYVPGNRGTPYGPYTAPSNRTPDSPGVTYEPSPTRRKKPTDDPANAPFYQPPNQQQSTAEPTPLKP